MVQIPSNLLKVLTDENIPPQNRNQGGPDRLETYFADNRKLLQIEIISKLDRTVLISDPILIKIPILSGFLESLKIQNSWTVP